MTTNLTRISAAPGSGKTRYITNRVIGALFRDEPVLLVSLDPDRDGYAEDIENLGARAHYHDCEIHPGEGAALGRNLTYICWARHKADGGGEVAPQGYRHLVDQLRVEPSSPLRPATWGRKTLVIVDGCEWLGRKPVFEYAAHVRAFIADCLADGHTVIACGERDGDTRWLEQVEGGSSGAQPPSALCAAS